MRTDPLRWPRRSKFLASFDLSELDLDHSKLISTILVKQDDIRGHRRQISGTSPSHEYVSSAPVYLSLQSMVFEAFVISLYRFGPIFDEASPQPMIEKQQSSALDGNDWVADREHT
jgi:hypothetical protein